MQKLSVWATIIVVSLMCSFRSQRTEDHLLSTAKNVGTSYYWITYSYNGTWRNSRTSSQRVYFIGAVTRYTCEYYYDCDAIKDRAKSEFKSDLTNVYETRTSGATINTRSTEEDADEAWGKDKNYYQRLGYQIVEVD